MFRIWPATEASRVGSNPHPAPRKFNRPVRTEPREAPMHKLIDAYANKPTDKNALRLKRHADLHPMSACLLNAEDTVILRQAIKQANDTEIGA